MGAKRSSFCGIFKACFSSGGKYDEYCEGNGNGRRIFASDEDRGRWIAEPGIDTKASDFIAKYYASRVTDCESKFAS
ncbi:hypothetical protein Lal_00003698 [Lupinus albus]|uniref:Uncharacterized protein n=1 Tax=Lupinus albus TaxID=3870 RepID=A0A6A5MIE0_LUPAL|nr:hypothetical protein Lalb_Chr08g0232971 [Lupinus albus]KAF1870492.1 hypothetical protein Lal_00003698 [Lupinus albus]